MDHNIGASCCAQALGCVAVRHFTRLMPLLLTWLHAEAAPQLRGAAAAALNAVTRGCWPHVGPHVTFLRAHLLQAREEAIAEQGSTGAEGQRGVGAGESVNEAGGSGSPDATSGVLKVLDHWDQGLEAIAASEQAAAEMQTNHVTHLETSASPSLGPAAPFGASAHATSLAAG